MDSTPGLLRHLGENIVEKVKFPEDSFKSGSKKYISNGDDNDNIYCSMKYKHQKDGKNKSSDIEKINENGDVEMEEDPNNDEKDDIKKPDSILDITYRNYEWLYKVYPHLCEYPVRPGFYSLIQKLYVRFSKGLILTVALPEKNALLILDHYAKIKYEIPPFSKEEKVDLKQVIKYRDEFVEVVNLFNEFGPNYTIFFQEESISQFEVELWMSYQDNNPDSCFAIYASAYNVVRFINNILIEHLQNPKSSFCNSYGLDRFVEIANIVSDNLSFYERPRDRDFNV